MSIRNTARALPRVSLVILAVTLALPAHAADDNAEDDQSRPAIVVKGKRDARQPATQASIEADRIDATVNAVNVEDTVKYLPSLVVRKRHIGDTQAPLATRTSGLGSSARSLVYADGALLSALIGNNNTLASPRWGLVAPQEIERIDVLYGPFSAAYPGNSIGAVVNITTRMPEKLEATATALTNLQQFDQYGTHRFLPTYQLGATLGDRFGPLALFASWTHTDSRSQPISYVTAARGAPAASAIAATGGYDDRNRTGAAVRVLGAGGLEHQRQDMAKLKAALDLGAVRLTYTGGLFREANDATAETYAQTPAGAPLYSGALDIDGNGYTLAANAFSGGTYTRDARHWSHALSATGSGEIDWQVIGTLYDFDHDVQRGPASGLTGAGQLTRLDGTGWKTLEGKLGWRWLSAGAHYDRFTLNSNRYATPEWRHGAQGARNLASRGKTETVGVWAQAGLPLAQSLTLTLGGRYEWWRAFDGFNYSLSPALSVAQPERRAQGFSPKAALEWRLAPHWSARLAFGKAYRFPTVGELYQTVTTGATLSVPDPDLRPERALSEELAIEHRDDRGSVRVSLFAESVEDALISQSAPLLAGSTQLFNYVQNVGRTRARGVEAAFDRRDLLPRLDLAASVTYTDAQTREDPTFPAAVGKMLPSVPRWKASAVVTWRPDDAVSLTAAARYASRNWGALDNSDLVGNTWQGFYKYFVVDMRAHFEAGEHLGFSVGVDNLFNDKYFLFHPFPQRSVTVEAKVRL